jgi:ABC-type amino acid transport system permease subunit
MKVLARILRIVRAVTVTIFFIVFAGWAFRHHHDLPFATFFRVGLLYVAVMLSLSFLIKLCERNGRPFPGLKPGAVVGTGRQSGP